MPGTDLVIVALSGGVDSSVAALRLRDAGYAVQCLHMSNWEDDGYCEAARDFHDARRVCQHLGLPLHRVNFAREYREQVFAHFLAEHRKGRTPNPDVLCNREIKFGTLRAYAARLGATHLATGHYARLLTDRDPHPQLLKARDATKDQSYFLHAVAPEDFRNVLFPLGDLLKSEVRDIARAARLPVAEKKDSTGICFIGERPFAEFLGRYIAPTPGLIRDAEGRERGTHRGLAFYTLGQRQGLGLGGAADAGAAPWYVAAKDFEHNELLVVQGHDHPLLFKEALTAVEMHWLSSPPPLGRPLRVSAKVRYRQPDQPCTATRVGERTLEIAFDAPQRSPAPGQYVVLYDGDRCLGGGTIERAFTRAPELRIAI